MGNEDLVTIAEQYFSSLNSIASRIHTDITETRLAYENLWDTLGKHERSNVINECIIKPEVSLKYALSSPIEEEHYFNDDLNSFHRNFQTGLKIVQDETSAYRDEHSAPFNVKTKSQLNLHLFDIEEKPSAPMKLRSPHIIKNDHIKQSFTKIDSANTSIPTTKVGVKLVPNCSGDEPSFMSKLMNKKNFTNSNKPKRDDEELLMSEKKIVIVPTNSSGSSGTSEAAEENVGLLENNDVIKSGYDFLANW